MNTNLETIPSNDHSQIKEHRGFPKEFWLFLLSEFFERIAFYGIRWALVLYFVMNISPDDTHARTDANTYYASYLALLYGAGVVGGFLSDRVFGHQNSIILGALLMMSGIFSLLLPDPLIFRFSLACIALGNGLYKPAMCITVGRILGISTPKRDAGFTLFYLVINIAGLLAPLLTQFFAITVFGTGNDIAFKSIFISSAGSMLLSLLCFFVGRSKLKGTAFFQKFQIEKKLGIYCAFGVPALLALLSVMLSFESSVLTSLLIALLFVSLLMLYFESKQHGTRDLHGFFPLVVVLVLNLLLHLINGNVIHSCTLIAMKWMALNPELGASTSLMLRAGEINALFLMSPLMVLIWLTIGKRNWYPRVEQKLGLGIIAASLGFGIFSYSANQLFQGNMSLPIWPMFVAYIFQAISELCLIPISLSAITYFAPARRGGLAIGSLYITISLGTHLAGFLHQVGGPQGELDMSVIANEIQQGFYFSLALGSLILVISSILSKFRGSN